ncbi:F-box/kelch-repeat protein At3g06240-like [Castanea sativa]|uniref:F-box/kelch-repeat protein At3g06240-like n=1 Tax=Castanea sativa TaxID=21020 RepID=UPI003F64B633
MLPTSEELPEDLVIQILLWLPVISLLRLKCVCKSWCDLISGQNFITKHLLHNQTTYNKNMNVGFLLLRREKTSHNYVFSKLPYETLEISSTQAVPSSYLGTDKADKFDIVGSSNGLVCLCVHDSLNIILWNPATKETKVVPQSQISYPEGKAFPQDLGFGFDTKSNDFKVVMILENYDHYERKRFSVAEVYCLSTNSWRKVHACVPGYILTYNIPRRTYTKGMLSWWAHHSGGKCIQCILSFDMSNESFLATTLPDNRAIGYRHYSQRRFFVFNKLVSLVIFIEDSELSESFFHIWSLLEFGVRESWTKLFTIGPLMGIAKPLGFFKNDSMFLENNEGQLLLCNLSTQEMTNLQIGGVRKSLQIITYIESLIFVKGENDLEVQNST